jgi:hypothetical protein
MKNIFLSLLLSVLSIAAFGQAGSLSQSVYRSRVNDSTTVTTPSGYGLLYYNNQRASPAWIFSNDQGATWQKLGSGSGAIADGSITYAKFQNLSGLSIFGRSANSSGVGADITAGSDGDVLRRSGTTLGFGQIPISSVTNLQTTIDAKVADAINNGTTTIAPSQNAVFDADALKLDRNLTVKTKTASHTLDSDDLNDLNAGKDILFIMNVASGHNFTVPTNATIDVDGGGHIYLMRTGVGQTTVVASGGVTVTGSSGGLLDPGPNIMMPLIQTANNTWYFQNGTGGSYTTWNPGFTGFNANPTSIDATYAVIGKFVHIQISMTAGTSNTTTFTITGCPIAPRRAVNVNQMVTNSGTTQVGRVDMGAGVTTMTIYATTAGGAWTASGTKTAFINLMFEAQ